MSYESVVLSSVLSSMGVKRRSISVEDEGLYPSPRRSRASRYASEDGDVVEEYSVGVSIGTPSTDATEDVAIMAYLLVCVKARNETMNATMTREEGEREGRNKRVGV